MIGSLVSKVFGILREFSMAAIFGTQATTDSWLMASIIPNLMYGLVSNTITNVVVPVLSGHIELDNTDARVDLYMDEVFTWILLGSAVLVGLSEIFSATLIHWLAPGFHGLRYRLSVVMLRIMLPTLPFTGLGAYINGILQSKRIFAPATVTPTIINVFRLIGIVVLGLRFGIDGVAIGFVAGQVAQVVYLVPTLASQKIRLKLRFRISHPWTRQSARLALPYMLSQSATVAGRVVDRIFASTLLVGRIAGLNFANVLATLPVNLLITPITAPLYTQLSKSFNTQDYPEFRKNLQGGFELVTMVIMPFCLAFIIFRVPIIRILYQHGAFNGRSTTVTAPLLMYWAIGLPSGALATVFTRGLFAQRLSRITSAISVLAIACNVAGDFLLIHPMGAAGLALATSLASWVRMLGLGTWLFVRGGNPASPRVKFAVAELAGLGAFCAVLAAGLLLFHLSSRPFGVVMTLLTLFTGGVALALYWIILRSFGMTPKLGRRLLRATS
jgi:putative peptidoglycan lipid II flippase